MEKQHIPYIEKYNNNKNYNGNYYNVLDRDSLRCVSCGSISKLTVHHIIGNRLNFYKSRNVSSMITLCRKCHSKEHAIPHSIISDQVLVNISFDFELYSLINEISNNTGNKKLADSYS